MSNVIHKFKLSLPSNRSASNSPVLELAGRGCFFRFRGVCRVFRGARSKSVLIQGLFGLGSGLFRRLSGHTPSSFDESVHPEACGFRMRAVVHHAALTQLRLLNVLQPDTLEDFMRFSRFQVLRESVCYRATRRIGILYCKPQQVGNRIKAK